MLKEAGEASERRMRACMYASKGEKWERQGARRRREVQFWKEREKDGRKAEEGTIQSGGRIRARQRRERKDSKGKGGLRRKGEERKGNVGMREGGERGEVSVGEGE